MTVLTNGAFSPSENGGRKGDPLPHREEERERAISLSEATFTSKGQTVILRMPSVEVTTVLLLCSTVRSTCLPLT